MAPGGNKVSPERLEEFRRIYKEASGEEITAEEALEMTHRLIALYKLLLLTRPLPDEIEKPTPPPPPAHSAAEEA